MKFMQEGGDEEEDSGFGVDDERSDQQPRRGARVTIATNNCQERITV